MSIPFSPNATVELIEVTTPTITVLEVAGGMGTSLLQAFQEYLTLDGGSPSSVMTNITPLDGGGV